MSFTDSLVSVFYKKSIRSIGSFSGYVVKDEIALDKMKITRHPVAQGAAITDHAFKEPVTLSISLVKGENSNENLEQIYTQLLNLQASAEKLKVVTKKRVYESMLIESIEERTDSMTENILSVRVTLVEIITVPISVTALPPRDRQKNPKQTGGVSKAGKKSFLRSTTDAATEFISSLRGN